MDTLRFPETEWAVQLLGPKELRLNKAKPIQKPGPHGILVRVEAVGLCFSDLKLLAQFKDHPRKAPIVSGLSKEVIATLPQSYVPEDLATVPGHEAVVRIVAVGEKVTQHKIGELCLVQADYRELLTAAGSNAAFGYGFEGALQEYVLLDERVVIDSKGNRYLIPVAELEHLSFSSIALVEPWACVEDSYVSPERRGISKDSRLLVVADSDRSIDNLEACLPEEFQGEISIICSEDSFNGLSAALRKSARTEISAAKNESFDDIIYFGNSPKTIELLNDKLSKGGMINIVLGGKEIGSRVSVGVGRVHYGATRWIGTFGSDPRESYKLIPEKGEIRTNDKVLVVGAGGPMGQMHVMRALSLFKGISLSGTDIDNDRLKALSEKAQQIAERNQGKLCLVNTKEREVEGAYGYITLMVPLGPLVQYAIEKADKSALINIFAGIPAPTKHEIDLDAYIKKGLFMFGTSGSTLDGMKRVLSVVLEQKLNTDYSVAAVSGMGAAMEGLKAVESRSIEGKILVYPHPGLRGFPLTPLARLSEIAPAVAANLDQKGNWTKAAEDSLLEQARCMEELVQISHYYGQDPSFVLAGGGNTSCKLDHATLAIKGSGVSLAEIEVPGFVRMSRIILDTVIKEAGFLPEKERESKFLEIVMSARREPERNQRPSVEVVLHNLMPQSFVVHTHPTVVNMLTSCVEGEVLCRQLFGDEVLWVPYFDPGCCLAKKVSEMLETYRSAHNGVEPKALLLQNHGLFVGGHSAEEVKVVTAFIIGSIETELAACNKGDPFGKPLKIDKLKKEELERVAEIIAFELKKYGVAGHFWVSKSQDIMDLVSASEGLEIAGRGALSPDQIVYSEIAPLLVYQKDLETLAESIGIRIAEFKEKYFAPPRIVLVEAGGLISISDSVKAAKNSAIVYEDAVKVMRGSLLLGGVRHMPERDARFIKQWEIESYRKKVLEQG